MPIGSRIPKHVTSNSHASVLENFVQKIEDRSQAGSMVFTLPYIPFPEAPPTLDEGYNDMMRPVYYSDHLNWSYGSTRGRVGDAWLKLVAGLPPEQMVQAIKRSGFAGIFVSRYAYKDRGAAIELELSRANPIFQLDSDDGHYSYFYFGLNKTPIMTPSYVAVFGKGFHNQENLKNETWNWSKRYGEIVLYNFSPNTLSVDINFDVSGIDDRKISISLNDELLAEKVVSANQRVSVDAEVILQPGVNALGFDSNKRHLRIASDPRQLAFRVFNFRLSAK